MKKIIILFILILLSSFSIAKTQKEEYQNDYLYSAEYFDYLIELAEIENEKLKEEEKQKKQNEITFNELQDDEIYISEEEPSFKLKIEESIQTKPYKDSFKKVKSKTIIPIGNKISIIQDMSKSRNKYNSHDYKILTGVELQPWKYFILSSGLETNFRGIDQNPTSKKVYLSPEIALGDKLSLKFHNKMNIMDYSSDHDIGLNISPFKSKIMDFGIYSGITRKHNGSLSESINFSTSFYF